MHNVSLWAELEMPAVARCLRMKGRLGLKTQWFKTQTKNKTHSLKTKTKTQGLKTKTKTRSLKTQTETKTEGLKTKTQGLKTKTETLIFEKNN